ncbi:hypothetical protein XAC3562_1200029 [Xanthomonas citri pv. citri]|uniref:Uncharacterized protein n=1 Tax=Xanthomonas citri pv. citri TaxID=611301 RepID=A0A0U5BNY6_XANCI|nr:hypothetical protein XAC3608_1970025 [Xanthomonas citri pv. citri]CEG14707.1 hypothetical protein XAC3562_1200029 [Xanthomonas citri pv. citri]
MFVMLPRALVRIGYQKNEKWMDYSIDMDGFYHGL